MKANAQVKGSTPSKAVAHSVVQAKSVETGFEDRRPEALEAQQLSAEIAQAKPKPNNTGLPDNLKSGIESLSGYSMDDVKVHYNSAKPSQLNAHAYAQGTDIHIASGQEQHLPHEAWHVAQQKQGRVQPTTEVNGAAVNDDVALEREADMMGAQAMSGATQLMKRKQPENQSVKSTQPVAQAFAKLDYGPLHNDAGTSMHVYIEGSGDSDIAGGSKPSVVPNWWPDPSADPDAADYFSNYVVQGHLLNMDLGGPGDTMDNLTPITRSTNTTHFTRIENEVKDAVLNQNQNVEYRVEADYSSAPLLSEVGNSPHPNVGNYLPYMAHSLLADYSIWDSGWNSVIGGPGSEIEILNEGPQNKGTFT